MSVIERAREVINTEICGLEFMATQLGQSFEVAVNAILTTKGRVIICGMGKSGIIGKKISASFASTGTASFYMHPGEAFHGDLGMVKSEDIFIAISNSGETEEVLKLLPFLSDNGNFLIAMTGRPDSTLAKNSHCHLDISVPKEACFLQLAPTSSTTATLVMGDALTVALMEERNFRPENFARFHPGGSLGKRLLSRVKNEMSPLPLPLVESYTIFQDVVNTVSQGMLGLCIVQSGPELGIITDGDIRRAMEKHGRSVFDLTANCMASYSPYSVEPSEMMGTALELMDNKGISSLLVKEAGKLVGILKK
ncbi:arabinose-5-phosphate isomerase [Vibrio azureus]|uniref:Arabinose 5-phosphate isomerase n=1 Tax=Vibrio azureus NBRC 104587 TaxID=1219077 RepID=U3API4_9VIBR|nr:KpsF/GutQ family sugar-phosphate isomerase [Vibrio azureus]AUI85122.1 arabinose-5-phosphate isomerase [Vibrio azureus]GAD75202.1 putative D-arabinose-5-phosphate isomerase [Vibrio azureus NBRC 104587]